MVSVRLLASFIVPALLGAAITQQTWNWCRPVRRAADTTAARVLVAALALPLGLGLCSCLYFSWLVASGPPGVGLAIVEGVVAAACMAVLSLGKSKEASAGASVPIRRTATGPVSGTVLLLTIAIAAACALAGFVVTVLTSPHGQWDAWMTWNLSARFLFGGGSQWERAFSETLRHPDYPLLVPGAVARAWYYAGTDTVAAPALIGFVFTAATVMLGWASLVLLRSRREAHLAALVLLGTTFLILHGASQYADVPVGWYFLAAVVIFFVHDDHKGVPGLVALAGLAAGLGGWTKNEGLMFLLALAVGRCGAMWLLGDFRRAAREMAWFAAGAAPALVLTLYFKGHFAPANYLFSPGEHGLDVTVGRLLDVGRYRFLAGAIVRELMAFGESGMAAPIWLLAAYLLCTGAARRRDRDTALWTTMLTGCLMAIGHLLVLLVAPGDMPRLASASLNRLILQLWPAAVFTGFMVSRPWGVRQPRARVREEQWT
jgi:hypothetical protein